MYFPPLNSNIWETKTPDELNWNNEQIQPLLDFLEVKNTKGFIILHNGKIVIEGYFNNHNATLPWYWASAGKTLTTAVTGIAEAEGLLDIDDKVSDYIGTGWTSAPLEKEDLITNKNLLTMTSGLDDGLGDDISVSNLQYIEDAGARWAYHNVYVKLQDVVAEASNQTWSNYFNNKLKNKIGMSGTWLQNGNFEVYWSNTRSMARFGLLTLANGKWNDAQIVPGNYLNDATNTSQNLNQAYGYMWWLNGKSTYRLPQSQIQLNGTLIPNAPSDMYCALGRDDQKIYVVPSKKLVIVRMGESAEGVNFALSNFDNDLWEKINAVIN
jgi:CubicO group peptidase (beta-lactamase class C family)